MRNRMVPISNNFPSKQNENPCICGEPDDDMKHIYSCKMLNTENPNITYEKIFENDVKNQKIVFERFKTNYEVREKKMETENTRQRILDVDPLYNCTVMEIN